MEIRIPFVIQGFLVVFFFVLDILLIGACLSVMSWSVPINVFMLIFTSELIRSEKLIVSKSFKNKLLRNVEKSL
jgi:hypothetical protein